MSEEPNAHLAGRREWNDHVLAGLAPPSAIAFDFNGTLSDDEPLLCEIYMALLAEHGRTLSQREYYDQLVGLSDAAIVAAWLGGDDAVGAEFIRERIRRYQAATRNGATISAEARAAVRYAAARAPLALVSSAFRCEIEPVLEASGLAPLFACLVTADDVANPKPDPECYLLMLERLGLAAAADAVAFEDTPAGVAAGLAAGLRVVGVTRTGSGAVLVGAAACFERLDLDAVGSLFAR